MPTTIMQLFLPALLLSAAIAGRAATVTAQETADSCILRWQGDERIEVTVDKRRGLLGAPVHVRVGEREISFDGFYALFNGSEKPYPAGPVRTRFDGGRLYIEHQLQGPGESGILKLCF